MTALDVLTLVDSAPVFSETAEDPARDDASAFAEAAADESHRADIAEAIRKFGLAELDAALATVKAAIGEARGPALAIAAEQLGQLAAAGSLHEGFARAALEEAAGAGGLIRDDGLKAVKSAIAAGIKLGKKQPRNLDHVRREATALKAGRDQRPSLNPSASSSEDSAAMASPSSSFFAAAPAPPAEGGESETPSHLGMSAAKASAARGAGGDRKPPRAVETEQRRNMRLAFFPLTDLGNAERFRERYLDKLLWCPALGWLAWDGKRWSRGGADDLVKIAEHDTVRAIQDEADEVRDSGDKDVEHAERGARDYVFKVDRDGNKTFYSDKIASWGRASEALNKLGALSKRGAPYFAIGVDKLDADKMKINVNNGTLVVARKSDGDYISFQPHDPGDLITKISPVDYDPLALCPLYDKFIGRVQPTEAMRTFLHQWFGLSLTGDVSEQKLMFLYGKGANGKSVLVDIISYVAGDYGETVPIESFLDHGKSRNAGQATPDLAILPGVRMLRTSEPEKNSRLAEAMLKLITGGEPIQARHLNRDFFKFYPQFKMTISGNYRPGISGADEGIWRRLRQVPFNVTIPKEERDIHLLEKLRAEASGILNRLLDGLRLWCDKGLIEPEDVMKATAEYRSSSDPLGRFLSTCVEETIGERVQSSVLYQVFEAWCKSSGETAWKQKGFSLAMEERGYKRKHSDVTWFLDVKLVRSVNDFVDHDGHPIRVNQDGKAEVKDAGDTEF
jgi:putative DNA primase/helicase